MKETTVCYIEKDNKYLMLHRIKKDKDPNKGKWIGVGGKIEHGESPEECNIREVLEETGLTLVASRYRGIVYFYSDIYEAERMHLFTATEFTGDIHSCDEGELHWINKQDLFKLNLWEGDQIFHKKLMEERTEWFEMSLYYKGDTLESVEYS